MAPATAVVLDKDKVERDDIRLRLSHWGVTPICFRDEWICLENIYHIKPRFAVLHTDSSDCASRFVNVAKAIRNNLPVVVLSGAGEIERFIQNNGLDNLFYLRYPADDKEFRGTIQHLQSGEPTPGASLVAGSTVRRTLIKGLLRMAASREPILIQGEPGVGKKRMVREIIRRSALPTEDLEFLDAGSLSGEWIQAARKRLADAGPHGRGHQTLAIENIERLPWALQSQLLPLAEDAAASGSHGSLAVLRMVSVARRNLWRAVMDGHFREDLYHRLSVFKVHVPPLRHHPDDIRTMAEYFTIQFSIHLKGVICRLSDTVMTAFLEYHWPGNVAELKRCIQTLMKADGTRWTQHLPVLSLPGGGHADRSASHWGLDVGDIRRSLTECREMSLKQARCRYVVQIEKKMLRAALAQTGGNCKKAAGLLDISYKSMLNKAKAYRLV